MPLLAIGAASAIVRFRRSRGESRQQQKWLAFSISIVALLIVVYGVSSAIAANTVGSNPIDDDWIEYLLVVAFLGVPVSIAFGVLKYRLYDIDIVLGKAVVYGALAVFITLVYAGIVVGIGAAIGARREPGAVGRGGRGRRARVPAGAGVGATPGEPGRLWRAGDAVPGARHARRAPGG